MMNLRKFCGTLALLAAVLLCMTCCAMRRTTPSVERELLCQFWDGRCYRTSGDQYWEEKNPDWDLYWLRLADQHSRPEEIRFSFTEDTTHTVFAIDKNEELLWSKELQSGWHMIELTDQVSSILFSVPDGEPFHPTGTGLHPQLKTALTGRKLAVLGDSVSAFTGYTEDPVYAYYNNRQHFGAASMWWAVLAEKTGMEICNINAVSGSGVVVLPDGGSGALNGNSERCTHLSSRDGEAPDEIVILLGGNDFFGGGVSTAQLKSAYLEMLAKIQKAYPAARIHVCTYYQSASLPSNMLDELNGMLRTVAETAGVGLIDLQDCGIPNNNQEMYMVDESPHPNERGQILVGVRAAQQMLKSVGSAS